MEYSQSAILHDGASVAIRRIGRADLPELRALFDRMSPESIRHRYMCVRREPDLAWVDRLDGDDEVALAVMSGTRILGVGRFIVTAPGIAEVAFEVGDTDHRRGIGTLLLEHLVVIGRAHGINTFHADVEIDNAQMLDVFTCSGFPTREKLSRSIYSVDMDIAETEEHVRKSTARTLEALRARVA
jgi:GNAT superfamily N-acetyltransferase